MLFLRATALATMFLVTAVRGEQTTYLLRGVLRRFDPQTGQATVSHDPVPGYMPAMTMDFPLADPAEVRALHPGDTFVCHLRVDGDRVSLEDLHKEEDAVASPASPPPLVSRDRAPQLELSPGSTLPDVELTGERGQPLHLHDFRGRALALTFIYLRCPLPGYCPLMNRNFQSAQALLARLGLGERARFLSVSMDAANDTPAQLAGYADGFGADRRTWTFATAPESAVRTLGGAVGLEFRRDAGAISHNLRTVVVNPDGTLRRIFRGNSWTPQELAAELRAAAPGL